MNKLIALFGILIASLAAVPVAAQSFGSSTGIAGDDVLFGQPGIDREPGSVFVYRRAGEGWAEAAKLSASDGIPGDRFGTSIAVDGDRMVVGAIWADSGKGSAYVFERGQGGAWRETARLSAPDGARGDSLGLQVALRGDVALVSYSALPDSGETGEILVFRRESSGAWRPARGLTVSALPSGRPSFFSQPESRFGRSIALGDGFAALSFGGTDSLTPTVVMIYPAQGEEWGEPAVVTAPENRIGFGWALAFEGDRLFVGAPGLDRNRGGVLVYRRTGDTWEEEERFQAVEPDEPEEPADPEDPEESRPPLLMGGEIAVNGEIWVNALGVDGFTGGVFRAREGVDGWTLEKLDLEIPDLAPGAGVGNALALGADVAAVGIPGEDYGAGAGAILTREGDDWELAAEVKSEIEPLTAVIGGPIQCNGQASIFPCQQVDLVAFLPVETIGGVRGVELNDIWGWTDPQSGREYALVGRMDGTSFVDITDPENPIYLGQLPKTETSPGSTWRDIKVYKDHAFIVADGAEEHGMQVFDLTRLRNVEGAPLVFTEDAHYDRIHSAHNIVINEDTGFAYTVGNSDGGETCGGGLHMIDIKDPKNPQFVGCFSDPSTGRRKTGYTHDAQCVLYRGPDEDYKGREICFGSNETAVSIADVTDKQNPRAISMAEYPNVGYTHQAWLTEDHHYLLMDDELDELNGLVDHTRTLIWDVSDLDDPIVIEEYLNPNSVSIDHNQYVVGDKVFQSNYVAGLRVIDISDIGNPKEVGFFDTVPYGSDGPRFDGSWSNYPFFKSGVIVVTSGKEGLFLLKYRPAGDQPIS
jgi:choice-of-anchor B domain-containing protein